MEQNIWIGLVKVFPYENCERIAQDEGAYTNVLTIANSSKEFRSKITQILKKHKLQVVEVEEEEPLSKRLMEFEVDKEILELSEEEFTDDTVKCSHFCIYKKE